MSVPKPQVKPAAQYSTTTGQMTRPCSLPRLPARPRSAAKIRREGPALVVSAVSREEGDVSVQPVEEADGDLISYQEVEKGHALIADNIESFNEYPFDA
jgi:hypothetical protein